MLMRMVRELWERLGPRQLQVPGRACRQPGDDRLEREPPSSPNWR